MLSPVARLLPLAAAAATFVLVPSAGALTITAANVNPPISADASTRTIIYYLDLQAGPTDERFSVLLTPPAFATTGGRDEGRSVDGPLQVDLIPPTGATAAPGVVGQLATDPSVGAACSDRDEAFHGYATGTSSVDVQLPAGARSTLAVRYGTGRRAPWVDTDLRLRFKIVQRLLGTYPIESPFTGGATSVDGAQSITATPQLTVRAGARTKIGAHLVLSTTPRGTWGDTDAPRVVRAGSSVRVKGRLLPALGGKRVQLRWRKGTGPLRTAKTVRTGKTGRFTSTLALPSRAKGTYELWAAYPSQSGGLAADSTSCPLSYRIR